MKLDITKNINVTNPELEKDKRSDNSDGETSSSDKENEQPSAKPITDNPLNNSTNFSDKQPNDAIPQQQQQSGSTITTDVDNWNQQVDTAAILIEFQNTLLREPKRGVGRPPKVASQNKKKNTSNYIAGNNNNNNNNNNNKRPSRNTPRNVKENVDPLQLPDNGPTDVIFEGTIVNAPGDGDTSVIVPITSSENFPPLDNAVMGDGSSEIMQVREVVCQGEELIGFGIEETQLIINVPNAAAAEDEFKTKIKSSRNRSESSNASSSSHSDQFWDDVRHKKMSKLLTKEQVEETERSYICDRTVIDKAKISKYMMEQIDANNNSSNKKIYVCTFTACSHEPFNRRDKCEVHIMNHLDIKPYVCTICNKFRTVTVSNVRVHINKVHQKVHPYSCHICSNSYYTFANLEDHLNRHANLKPYGCDLCSFKCGSKQSIRNHILTHYQSSTTKEFACEVCGKMFLKKNQMQSHKLTHDKSQRIKCTCCSNYFSSQERLQRHMQNSHQRDYKCAHCHLSFKNKKALNNHKSTHAEPQYKCDRCTNSYKSRHTLMEHINSKHEGKKDIVCKICSKTFAQKSHLAAHMTVHSDVRYDCPACKKNYTRKDNLKVHLRGCLSFKSKPELHHLLNTRSVNLSKNVTARAKAKN